MKDAASLVSATLCFLAQPLASVAFQVGRRLRPGPRFIRQVISRDGRSPPCPRRSWLPQFTPAPHHGARRTEAVRCGFIAFGCSASLHDIGQGGPQGLPIRDGGSSDKRHTRGDDVLEQLRRREGQHGLDDGRGVRREPSAHWGGSWECRGHGEFRSTHSVPSSTPS